MLLLVAAYGLAEMSRGKQKAAALKKTDTTAITNSVEAGKKIYTEKCASCHGSDGKAGLSGAKDLSATQLNAEEQKSIIRNGKSKMFAFPTEAMSDEQLDALLQYTDGLKQ